MPAGDFPKGDGDILYGQDVDEGWAWAVKAFRARDGRSGVQVIETFADAHYYRPSGADTRTFDGNVQSGAVGYPHVVQWNRLYSDFPGTALIGSAWMSGINGTASLSVASNTVTFSITNGSAWIVGSSVNFSGVGGVYTFFTATDTAGEFRFGIAHDVSNIVTVAATTTRLGLIEVRAASGTNFVYGRVWDGRGWSNSGSADISALASWRPVIGVTDGVERTLTARMVSLMSGTQTAAGSWFSQYRDVGQFSGYLGNTIIPVFDTENQGATPIFLATANSGTNYQIVSGNAYPTTAATAGSYVGVGIRATTVGGSPMYFKGWSVYSEN